MDIGVYVCTQCARPAGLVLDRRYEVPTGAFCFCCKSNEHIDFMSYEELKQLAVGIGEEE